MLILINKMIILICLISTIARFALDSYLPSLPAIATSLAATDAYSQMTITLYLLGFSISQLIYGPLSDYYGRKKIIIAGLSIFVIGNIICGFSTSIYMLISARLISGIGAGASAVLNRAITSDKYQGADFAKAWSYTTTTLTFTLIFAPLIGGFLQDFFGWRANITFMTAYVAIILLILLIYLPETNNVGKNYQLRIKQVLKNYLLILRNKEFIAYIASYTFAFAGLIAYFQVSPFLFIKKLGYSAFDFGLLSLVIAASYFVGGLIVQHFVHKLGVMRMLVAGIIIMAAGGLLMIVIYLLSSLTALAILLPASIYVIGARLVIPNAMAGCLQPYQNKAGCAAALIGFIQFMGTAIISYLLLLIDHQNQLLLAITLLVLAGLAFISIISLATNKKYYYQMS